MTSPTNIGEPIRRELNTGITKKTRIEFIDLAKGVCILLVVIVHVIPELDTPLEFLACLRMPLYFCLSGLFFKDYGGLKHLTIKKVNKILIPFVAWYLIGYLIYYACRILIKSQTIATFSVKDLMISNEIYNLPVWFLLCLFWSNLIFYFISRLSRVWYQQFVLIMLVAAIGYIMSINDIFNFLYLGSSLTCMPFFYLGYALKQTMLLYPSTNKVKDIIIMTLCLVIAFLFLLVPEHPPRIVYYTNEIRYGNPLQIYLGAAIFVVGVLLLCKIIGHIPFVSWLGRYSIIVLVTHMWLKDITGRLLLKFWGNTDIVFLELINLGIIILLMILVIPFCIKYLPHITAQKDIFPVKNNKTPDDTQRDL